ncbi:MAG: hypothetical protein EB168_08590, partial [Euryarchaeota archaeon]|nr:hypothetical protein [Euryarchaeota archaeon]
MATTNIDGYDLKGIETGGFINEDVMQKIWDVSKIPLPFTDMVGSNRHKNSYFEWVKDKLREPNVNNAEVDGADAANFVAETGERVGNHSQISVECIATSHRADASDTIGYAKQLAYELTKGQQNVRRDVEAIALFNQASDPGTSTAPGKTGGLPSWIETTVINGTAGGYDHGTGKTVAATPGTAAALSFQDVKDAVMGVYKQGAESTTLMSSPEVISALSTYLFGNDARIANLHADQGKSSEKATALGSVNVVVTDFGTLRLVSNRLQPKDANDTDFVFILDPEFLSLS